MALRWLEAFQGSQNETINSRLYTNVAGGFGVSFADEYGRVQFDSSNLIGRTPSLVASPENSWIVGFGFQLTQGSLNTSPSAFPHIGFRVSGGEQCRLEIVNADITTKPGGLYYKLRVMRGATELARSVESFPGNIQANRRTYFEFKVTVRDGTDGSFEARYFTFKGGPTPIAVTWDAANTGINTADQASDGADIIEIAHTTGDANDRVAFTDFYACDNTGAKNNDYLGKLYMEAIKPQGNGNELDWVLAGSAASIEDALNESATTQSVAEDDKRITSDVVGDISLVTMTNLSSVFGQTPIVGIQVRVFGKMETTGTRDVQFMYRKTTGTPAQVGGEILTLSTTSIVGAAETLEDDPNTATDWVLADINGIELGVELDA